MHPLPLPLPRARLPGLARAGALSASLLAALLAGPAFGQSTTTTTTTNTMTTRTPASGAAPAASGARAAPAPGAASASMAPLSPQDRSLVASAMQAAPARVADNATIVVMESDGRMRTLRQGTNGFTCMPDNPATPGPDPMCMDRNALEWAQAWMAKRAPVVGRIGFMYMLAGGTDASNTDPFAQKPTASNAWISTGPHVMIVGAEPAFYELYPRMAQPDTRQPYIMWPGTSWQHLMIPVQ